AKICKLDGHGDNVRCVRIDEGGSRVVSGSSDGTLRVWDVRQQCCLGVYELAAGSVWAMHPSPHDSDIYYSGGIGQQVFRTDFRTGCSTLVCISEERILDMAIEEVPAASSGSDSGGGREGAHQEDEADTWGRSRTRPSNSLAMWLSCTKPEVSLWGGGWEGQSISTGVRNSTMG
ncbi:unnamed protein product, partial [Discosporangium mesarthrocarpum]